MNRQTTAGDLRRGDILEAIDGHPIGETVHAIHRDGDTVTTRRGPQRRRTVRHRPVGVPVTTDPPLPAWRLTERPRQTDRAKLAANAAAFDVGVVLGLANRRPVEDTTPVIDQLREANASK